MKRWNLKRDLLLTAATGGLIGMLVQAAQNAAAGGAFCGWMLLCALGTVCEGPLIWVALGTALSLHARCGLHAAIRCICLFSALLTGYVLTSELFGGWFNDAILSAGLLMMLPAAVAAWVICAHRRSRLFRALLIAAGFAALAVEVNFHGGCSIREWNLLLPLLVLHIYAVCSIGRTALDKQREAVLY